MAEQLASPFAVAFTWMLWHFVWQGTAVAMVYWLLFARPEILAERREPSGSAGVSRASPDGTRRSARNRYAVSLTMLAFMAIFPIATFAWLYEPYATIQPPVVDYRWSDAADQIDMPVISRNDLSIADDDKVSADFASNNRYAIAPEATIDLDSIRFMLDRAQPYLLMLWGLGVMCSGFRLAAGFLNIVWLRLGIQPIPDALKQRSVLLARKLGLNVSRVFSSPRIHEAAVVGFWRPVVLLPTAWMASLPPDVLEAVIAHELAHIRRLDVWVNLLQRLLESLFFYHPAVWWLSNRVRLDREMCCDELAVQVMGNRGQYAIALEQVGRMQVFGTPSLATSFRGDRKMKLYSRIQNILGNSNAPAREPAFLVGIVLAALALVLTGVIGNGVRSTIANAQDREPRFSEQERPSQDRRAASQEEEPPLTDRERKLMETVKELQQELNQLRSEVRGRQPFDIDEEFRSYDRNRDSKIARDEWFEVFVSQHPQAGQSLSQIKKLKGRRDVLMKTEVVDDKEMQNLTVQISGWENELKHFDALFSEIWNQVDSNRSDYVTQAEFARWWNQGAHQQSGHDRPSQILRRDRLEPLMDQRKMLLGRFSENHPSVADVTIRIESLEERIKSMEEAERNHPPLNAHRTSQILRREQLEPLMDQRKMLLRKYSENHPLVADLTIRIDSLEERIKSIEEEERKGSEERVRSSDYSRDRGPRDGEGMRPGLRESEGSVRGPRNGERGVQGPRDGDRPSFGPRDGEGGVRGPRDGERPNSGSRDGDRTSKGPRDGEPRSVGPRDGEGSVRGPRDGGSPKLGLRDGETSRVLFPKNVVVPPIEEIEVNPR